MIDLHRGWCKLRIVERASRYLDLIIIEIL